MIAKLLAGDGARAQGWRAINTAPEGTLVLVHDDGYVGPAIYENGRWLDTACGRADAFFDPAPQHWWPIPDPPPTGAPAQAPAPEPR